MLVSFSVKNYRSFAERQTLSFVAGTSAKKDNCFSFPTSNSLAPHLLRSSCLLGANASGKTTFIDAMSFFKKFVISSAKDMQKGEEIRVVPNKLVKGLDEQPTEFEIIFIHGDALYQYGFAADQERVWAEWLFSKPNDPKTRMRELFQREYDEKKKEYAWKINNTEVKGDKKVWQNATRPNSLFLSTSASLNSDAFSGSFDWIQEQFRIIGSPERLSSSFTAEQISESGWKDRILGVLKSTDLKICDIDIIKRNLDETSFPRDMPEPFKRFFLEELKNKKDIMISDVFFYHLRSDGQKVPFDLYKEESDGTRVLFTLAGPILDVLDNGYTLVVDELHNSLHPHALKMLIGLFQKPEINKKNAQLFFTSHETSVLAKGFMHQDQITFAELGKDESTQLLPLSDYHIRDINRFQELYLNGRFGGVPNIKDFADGE